MEAKKNPRADIHQHRSKFFLVGLMISLSLVITAFEWRTAGSELVIRKVDLPGESMPVIQITQIDPPKVIAPPSAEKPKPQTTSSSSLNPISITEVPDYIETEIPQLDMGDPFAGITLNVEPEVDSSNIVFITSEIQPEPIGGLSNFYKTISQNLKYPPQARQLGVEGKVFVDFVVDRFGKATNIKISKGIGAGCDEEAMRVVAIPKWNAGRQRGKAVNVRIGLQINFKLDR